MRIILPKKLFYVLAITLLLAGLTACGGKDDIGGTVADRYGNEFVIPKKADKIVSLSPIITEMLSAFGTLDRIVGSDQYSAELEGMPADIAIFDMMRIDLEQLVALSPDVIYIHTMSKSGGEDPLKTISDMGIPVIYVDDVNNITDIQNDILFVGRTLSMEKKAQDIIGDMDSEIADIVNRISIPETPLRVYFEISPAPYLYSFGTGVFLNEMLELLGVENIFASTNGWTSLSEEIVITENPNIIMTNVNYIDNPVDEIMSRTGWDTISAVQNGSVYLIDTDSSSRANQNILLAFKQMAKAIYPELDI